MARSKKRSSCSSAVARRTDDDGDDDVDDGVDVNVEGGDGTCTADRGACRRCADGGTKAVAAVARIESRDAAVFIVLIASQVGDDGLVRVG
jgi:hypothetical protein